MEQEIQQLIAACQSAFASECHSPFLSHVRRAELEELQRLGLLLQKVGPEQLLQQLQAEESALQANLEQELDRPSFDWYDDHYYAKVLDGILTARHAVQSLLEQHSP